MAAMLVRTALSRALGFLRPQAAPALALSAAQAQAPAVAGAASALLDALWLAAPKSKVRSLAVVCVAKLRFQTDMGVVGSGDAVAQEDPQQRPEQAAEEHRALPGLPHVRLQEAAPPAVHELLQEGQVLRLSAL